MALLYGVAIVQCSYQDGEVSLTVPSAAAQLVMILVMRYPFPIRSRISRLRTKWQQSRTCSVHIWSPWQRYINNDKRIMICSGLPTLWSRSRMKHYYWLIKGTRTTNVFLFCFYSVLCKRCAIGRWSRACASSHSTRERQAT
jgi:hypothetical protein